MLLCKTVNMLLSESGGGHWGEDHLTFPITSRCEVLNNWVIKRWKSPQNGPPLPFALAFFFFKCEVLPPPGLEILMARNSVWNSLVCWWGVAGEGFFSTSFIDASSIALLLISCRCADGRILSRTLALVAPRLCEERTSPCSLSCGRNAAHLTVPPRHTTS